MKRLNNDIYIQQGENFSLDFEITNERGDPYMLFKGWRNPYLVITVTSALYEQRGGFKQTFWLDLDRQLEEQMNGEIVSKPTKKFISTEALYIGDSEDDFAINQILAIYGESKMVLNPASDFDVTNYLFFIVDENDVRTYKYIKSYTLDENGDYDDVIWESYNFRVVKQFDTSKWTEQQYYYDIKILTGTTIEEYVKGHLSVENISTPDFPWSDAQTIEFIEQLKEEELRNYIHNLYDNNVPLIPEYDTKLLILDPTKIFVGVNLQGGIK